MSDFAICISNDTPIELPESAQRALAAAGG